MMALTRCTQLPRTLLVANRGEIALRVFQAARALRIRTVGVAPADDIDSPHTRRCDVVVELPGSGPAAYLDIEAVIAAARESGSDAVHPGYGFLSESARFAHPCALAGLTFVGPSGRTTLVQMTAFLREQQSDRGPAPAVVIKALAGGGGRGVRVVRELSELERNFRDSEAEARAAFGEEGCTSSGC